MGVLMDGFARERKFVVDQVRGVQVEWMNTHVEGRESYKCGYWVTKKKETPFVEHANDLHSFTTTHLFLSRQSRKERDRKPRKQRGIRHAQTNIRRQT